MHSPLLSAPHALGRAVARRGLLLALVLGVCFSPATSSAQVIDDDSSVSLNAMMKLQGGMFVPLASNKFKPYYNTAERREGEFEPANGWPPCDPIVTPRKPCFPTDHGKKPGSASIARATLQVEAHWDFSSKLALHGIFRAVRSAELSADDYGRAPDLLPRQPGETDAELSANRSAYDKSYVAKNYYNEVDLREFYLDYYPNDWLTFRIGRQQVAWGETGQYRLLDVVNPSNNLWHFGPLESFEDQRIPLWMGLATVEIPAMRSALELLFVPGVDRARDTVNAPLSFGGAWGLPYSSSPPTYEIQHLDFRYPGGELAAANMRGGARLKGVLGDNGGYSLVYMSTHMPNPVLTQVNFRQDGMLPDGTPRFDNLVAENAVLEYPRTNIVGGSFELTIPSPVASTIRFEGAVNLDQPFSPNTDQVGSSTTGVTDYGLHTKPVINYALVFQRPTMIRWLNPTQNFLLVAQFMHTYIPTDEAEDNGLNQVIGFNDWRIQKNSYTMVAHARTSYAHGIFEPRITGVYIHNPNYADSGFLTLDLGFRIGPHYRVNLTITDFFGGNPYRDVGLFRDRDELNAAFTLLF